VSAYSTRGGTSGYIVWVHHYNHRRPHTACGDQPPASRLHASVDNVVATGVSNQAADNPHLLPMLVETELNSGAIPRQISADAGYAGETNLYLLDHLPIDGYVAIDKDKHSRHEPAPWGRIPKAAGLRERMRRKTRTKKGRKVYARRKHVVEPVFGFIKQALGFRQFLLRGLDKVPAEWELVNLAYNLRRLHASGRRQVLMAT